MAILQADFDFVTNIVRNESAIVLEKGKEYLVETRLSSLARREGFESMEQLIVKLRSNLQSGLQRLVVEALTTNETSFFRDIEPFEVLKQHIIPELLTARAKEKSLSIWCAAASTGQEPYSVAMMLREHFPQLASWKITYIATDINQDVLKRAQSGVFSQLEVNRGLPVQYLVKYFEKKGIEWCLKDDVKKMIGFRELNLIKPWPRLPQFDIVMIRNVLIYFDADTKRAILANIRKQLRLDGFMFLGSAETTLNLDDNFERVSFGRGSCYRLKSRP